jgi:hypothetical protein
MFLSVLIWWYSCIKFGGGNVEAVCFVGKAKDTEEANRGVKKCEIVRKYGIRPSMLSAFIMNRHWIEKNINSNAGGNKGSEYS